MSVGNLVENKGHHIAIEAICELPEFQLVVAGEGPERERLEMLSQQHGVSSRVKFVGRVDQDQLATYYSAADILVLPSSREGWPNVLLESMACGTPVVATAVGGVPEIITSASAGRMIEHRNAADLCAAVTDLWAHLPGRAAVRSCAESCSWQRTSQAQLELFSRIAADQKELTNA
jgi:glycosyltransferase involved in cell wall biosynthesis